MQYFYFVVLTIVFLLANLYLFDVMGTISCLIWFGFYPLLGLIPSDKN